MSIHRGTPDVRTKVMSVLLVLAGVIAIAVAVAGTVVSSHG